MGLFDRLLDASVVRSFDRYGFERHLRAAPSVPRRDLTDRAILVTGATAGIGEAAARSLAGLGARVWLGGRDAGRTAAAQDRLRAAVPEATVGGFLADLGHLAAVQEALVDLPVLDGLVLNAGAMPLERRETPEGHELVWASQVLGHALVVETLARTGRLADGARVMWVASGGMYLQTLDLELARTGRPYQRHTVYANAKRAQVVLAARQAGRFPDTWFGAMHPGWVDTQAVAHSMPVFQRIMGGALRTPAQGADTLVWAMEVADPGASGRFWFDRRAVSPVAPWSRPTPDARADALVEAVDAAIAPFLPEVGRPAGGAGS